MAEEGWEVVAASIQNWFTQVIKHESEPFALSFQRECGGGLFRPATTLASFGMHLANGAPAPTLRVRQDVR